MKGQVIDGRNRLKACLELGIEPRTEEWIIKGSVNKYIISKNIHRRHLNESQRAMMAAALLPILKEEGKRNKSLTDEQNDANLHQKRTTEMVGEILNVSASVLDASKIANTGIEELKQVVNGENHFKSSIGELITPFFGGIMMNREKAFEDEILIDITYLAKQVYFKYPVAITAGLFLKLENNMGLVWDALNLLYFKIKRERKDQNVFYEVKLGNIIAICSPGDNEEPVITIMMSNEATYFKEERGQRLALRQHH